MTEHDLPVPGPLSRRRFIAAAGIAGAAAALPLGAGSANAVTASQGGGVPGSSPLAAFVKPDPRTGARFRWWWPCGNVDAREIAREVDEVARAGFGGLEIADVHHSMDDADLDPQRHGWATTPWIAAVKAALSQAHRRGITIDLSIGPSWPAAVPTVDPDSPAAATELAHGRVALTGGTAYEGEVPPPERDAHGATEQTLIAVHATKVVAPPSRPGQPEVMDPTTWVDLTDSVTDGAVAWTPPDAGDWVLMSYWQRGSGQEPEAGPHTTPTAYVVDHFSRAGTEAVTSYWERNILDREMRRLIQKAGNTLFEDSLEMETDATLWTPGYLDEFQARIGYDLRPYLPIIVEDNEKYLYMYDSTLSNQVRDDAAQVLSDLYNENHLLPLRAWAHDLGLELRVQGYGLETDSVYQAALFDQPESESLGFKNLDDYRALAGGRDMGGNTILSCEATALHNGAYNTTWFKVLNIMGSVYAGGVNQAVLHGFSYADAPGAAWPGFAAFSPYYNDTVGYGESWGPRMPMWAHARDVADHMARTQGVLQSGVNRADLTFFRQKGWTATGIGVGWGTSAGIPIGWSYGYLSAPLLELDSAYVEDGRLAPDGPAYQAIVIEGDRFRGKAETMQVEAARSLERLSRRGLRLVFLGSWTDAGATGLPADGEDAEVKSLVDRMIARSTTAVAPTEADMPEALASLGVERAVEHETSSIMHVHRHVAGRGRGRGRGRDDVDLFYVANARHAENRRIDRVEQDVWFTAASDDVVPYRLDTWTGEVTEIAQYEQDGRRFKVHVALNPAESVVIAFAEAKPGRRSVPALTTDADAVRRAGHGTALRATAAGTYTTTFADGRTEKTSVAALPEPVALDAWDLRAESWGPGATADSMKKTRVDVELDALVPWTEVDGLEDASGIGRYRTTVTLDKSWRDLGAYLDLGTVFDTFRVTVNGRRVSPQTPLDTRVDLGDALRTGRNVIEVEAPTTLFNRLRVENPTVFGSSPRQDYGLVGPVAITPYREVLVRR